MSESEKTKKFVPVRRKAVNVSETTLVNSGPLREGTKLPLLVQPAVADISLASWAATNAEWLETQLLEHGGLLFRNFKLDGPTGFEHLIATVSGETLEYRERSSPRSQVSGNIYTSTEYPPEYPIFLHNENSYQFTWPGKIFFFCVTAPQAGGETPIADIRKVYQRIDPSITERFARKGWMYVRNFSDGLGLSWQTVFQTTNRSEVEEYCRRNDIEVEWKDGNRLRTRAVRSAISRHPRTGEPVWFNHCTFFHVSTLVPAVRDALLSQFAEDELPSNTYYGDGTPIEAEVLEQLRAAYDAETIMFPWQAGDVLMLDNMLVAHGRASFNGPRKVLVGMANPISRDTAAIRA